MLLNIVKFLKLLEKVLEDLILENSFYCQIGLFTCEQLNLAEYSLFSRLDYKVNYAMEDVEQIYNEIFAALPNQRKFEFFHILIIFFHYSIFANLWNFFFQNNGTKNFLLFKEKLKNAFKNKE